LVKELLRRNSLRGKVLRSISYTTRDRRPREIEGKDYYFVGKKKFLSLAAKNFFLEYKKVVDDFYGTPRALGRMAHRQGKALLLCIDVKGALEVAKNTVDCRAVTIFVKASRKQLLERFRRRKELPEVVRKRMDLARREMGYAGHYDYVVTNDKLKAAVVKIEKIILNGGKLYERKVRAH